MKTIKKNVSHKKKLSRKGEIYGYGRKQNNSRLKMKSKRKSKSKSNIKKKRSILRGGSMGNISSNGNPVDRNNGFILVSKKSIVESLNLSPNYISFKINNKEEISFKIDEISVEKLQYFLLQKLLKITKNNEYIKLLHLNDLFKKYYKYGEIEEQNSLLNREIDVLSKTYSADSQKVLYEKRHIEELSKVNLYLFLIYWISITGIANS